MFDDFFEKNPPIQSELTDKEHADRIKAAVLKSIRENPNEGDFEVCKESEVTPMKKRNIARTFIIAAAVASLGTMSLVSANGVTDNLSVSDNLTKTNVPDLTDRWTKADGSENECIADDEIFDGKKELYNIVAIDENGEEILIDRDYIEWAEYKDGTFDIWYEAPSGMAEKITDFLGAEYKRPEPEEDLMESDNWSFDGEDAERADISFSDFCTDNGGSGKWEADI